MKIRISSSVVAVYMLAALSWWAYLLWRSNDQEAELRTRLLLLQSGTTIENIEQHPDYELIKTKKTHFRVMIVAEGMIIIGFLMLGLQIIRRTANKEVAMARQKRNFLLSITHELKSPIAAIRLVLETFLHRSTLTREQIETFSANALKDTARLQHLVQDLLLAARLEDSWRPVPESVSLHSLVSEIADRLKIRFPNSLIINRIPEDLSPVQADRSGLNSVLQNLIENALKYDADNNPVEVSAAPHKGRMQIKVADQGQGIPPEERQSVFEKFYRLGNEETRKAKGTGLGLYIVRQVVNAHGGAIYIADNTPRGTVFTIEI